jgi:flavin-dependent dehydrogenase
MPFPLPIEIVGGGLAGLSLGLALRRAGAAVTVFEAGDYPRHRVCGEFITGLDGATRRDLGLDETLADAWPHRSATYHLLDERLPSFPLPAPAWGISRHTLDTRLARAFTSAGGDLRTRARLAEDEEPEGRVFAGGRRRHGPFWAGLKAHLRGIELADDLEVHLGRGAYLGLSRVEDGSVNLCGIFSPQPRTARGAGLILEYLAGAGLRGLAGRLSAAEWDSDSVCVCAAPLGSWRCARSGRIRVGDACATIPPFTGNGLAMALQSAALALPPLASYASGGLSWAEAARAVGRAQRRRFGRRLALAACFHPFYIRPVPQRILAAMARRRLLPVALLYSTLG